MKRFTAILAIFIFIASINPSESAQAAHSPIHITWLGHAAFDIVSPGGTEILIDPFLTENPKTPPAFKDLSRYHPKAILITHSHFDHTGDVLPIAKASKADVISIYEYVNTLDIFDAQKKGGNVGGTFKEGDITIHIVPAMHSSEPGRAVGFVLTFANGESLYHTGDTWIFSDMAWIEKLYHPNIILLGVGGGYYTEDPTTAALAVHTYFKPQLIIPMHYGTFPIIATPDEVKAAFAGDPHFKMLMPGQSIAY